MGIGIFEWVLDIATDLKLFGLAISLILILLGGIAYGLAQTQPAERRGKFESIAIGMFVGGLIVAAIVGASEFIRDWAADALVETSSNVTAVN